jgi:LDH2 family malate/lactate/ureidoglycolate dehydrogenase
VVDGHDGVGGYISRFCVEKVIEKARQTGVAFCSARNSNHFGMAGLWAEMAARGDMIGFASTNTRTCAIPTFGRERLLGTNPIAICVPSGDGGIFLLDMATTTVAHGKVEVYDRRNKPMPLGWAVDENGVGTTDATTFEQMFLSNDQYGGHLFLGGEGEESGGHKGYGLGLLVELLCAGLSLGTFTADTFVPGRGSGTAHFFGAMRLGMFGRPEEIKSHIAGILGRIRRSEKAAGHERIYIHGEKETEARANAMKNGVFIDDATKNFLGELAKEFGAAAPEWR